MRIERLLKLVILVVLTIAVLFQISFSLVQSWSQPQIQSRLELYQTNLLLHATEWQSQTSEAADDLTPTRNALIGG
ncbi:MAG TPA: CPBP family intramembrane metalloprotease domain-containing protein, partial [Cyanobacteria bacterium UBA11148]|nr:CPBP family intramembrane metalloprotease domain-containing protein [Cyanobacteria bacterium UBA11148]